MGREQTVRTDRISDYNGGCSLNVPTSISDLKKAVIASQIFTYLLRIGPSSAFSLYSLEKVYLDVSIRHGHFVVYEL